MAESFRELYGDLTRTVTRFIDVFVQGGLDCVATVEVTHEGETYVVMWDGLRRPQDFRVLERNGSEQAVAKDWRHPGKPEWLAAVAVAIRPLYDESRAIVRKNRDILLSAKIQLHEDITNHNEADQTNLGSLPDDERGDSTESQEHLLQ